MRVFVTKAFARFASGEDLDDADLVDAVLRAENGLVDADLGGSLIKQRVARRGQGRSGGFRTVIALRSGDRAVFLHGCAKSDTDNISRADLARLKAAAKEILSWDTAQIETLLKMRAWREVL